MAGGRHRRDQDRADHRILGAVPILAMVRGGRQSEVREEKVEDEEGKKKGGKASSKKNCCHTLAAQLQKVFLPPGTDFLRRNFPNIEEEFF